MSDVNAVIVQPFKQFVKVRRAASKNEHCRDAATTQLRRCRRREAHHTRRAVAATQTRPRRRARGVAPAPPPHYCATHTPPPRRRRAAPVTSHTQDSIHLVKKCTKPDRKEFARIASATMIGFLIMGFVGFFVKLVHIPINNILMT